MKNKYSDLMLPVLAAFLVVCFFGIVIILCFHAVPAENKDMVNIFVGLLGGFAGSAVGFYYHSSKGSADKDVTIANSTLNASVAPPVVTPTQG